MKKYFKNLAIYIVIAIAIQGAFLTYINNVYLKESTVVVAKTPEKKEEPKKEDNNILLKLKPEMKNTIISESSKYIAYENEGSIYYKLLQDEKDAIRIETNNMLKYKWLYNDEMLIAEKNNNKIEFFIYNIDEKNKTLINSLSLRDKNTEIEDIVVSPLKKIAFVKVKTSRGIEIYKLNGEKDMERVKLSRTNIEDVKIIPHEDKIIYRAKDDSNLYISYISKSISFGENGEIKILGVDKSDTIYVATKQDDKITKIYYGNINTKKSEWKTIDLKEPITEGNFYLAENNTAYQVIPSENKIKSLIDEKEFKYKGSFLKLYGDKVISSN
ncbi:hypothetical protein SAMN02745163_01040 [Clostridium cavendishii DSM 21758]|uniref:Uncharacterized protein n=1 Tax=Clostridium cavendishii DSM 21758 TaxID=1121302 RepID=A0A1M6F562_9CLOT|nr:hypothetical protein [Clostridium cavendishii]SHI92874.1 hypothetical protein SAMN02745163_01040 [Clostridium cavendishii DSM 21758]